MGVKDKNNISLEECIPYGLALLALLVLILLLAVKHNVKIYAEKNGKFKLIGSTKISKKNLVINVDKFLDKKSYWGRIKVRLNKTISRKVNTEEIAIKYKERYIRQYVKFEDEPYEIIIDDEEEK